MISTKANKANACLFILRCVRVSVNLRFFICREISKFSHEHFNCFLSACLYLYNPLVLSRLQLELHVYLSSANSSKLFDVIVRHAQCLLAPLSMQRIVIYKKNTNAMHRSFFHSLPQALAYTNTGKSLHTHIHLYKLKTLYANTRGFFVFFC